MFNPATLCMYVSVLSQEPVIQLLSFVDVLHVFFVLFLYINYAVCFLVSIVLHFFKADYMVLTLLIVKGCTVTYSS